MKLSKNMFSERERGLENEFFYHVDQKLIKKLKQKSATEKGRVVLSEVTGISDRELLDELLDVGIRAECLVALSLVPLVQLAWADRIVDSKECAAVLQAATTEGIDETTASYQLLIEWLHHKPGDKLFSTWRRYVGAVVGKLNPEQAQQLQYDIMRRTLAVAEAAGGFLGIGSVSKAERSVLDEIDRAFAT